MGDSEGVNEVIISIDGKDDFLEIVGDGQVPGGTLRVVKFWAPWCRACKGLEPKYKRIAGQYPGFEFLQLNWEVWDAATPCAMHFSPSDSPNGCRKIEFSARKLELLPFPWLRCSHPMAKWSLLPAAQKKLSSFEGSSTSGKQSWTVLRVSMLSCSTRFSDGVTH